MLCEYNDDYFGLNELKWNTLISAGLRWLILAIIGLNLDLSGLIGLILARSKLK